MDPVRAYLFICLIAVGILLISLYLIVAFDLSRHVYDDTPKPSDVILVLGARAHITAAYNPCLVSRMMHAVELYNDKLASTILVSGGTDKEDNVNEAETMKKMAVEMGVPAEHILLEPKSTSTYENLFFSQKIMRANNLHSVIIVTEPFHSPRVELVAQKIGLDFTTSPAIKNSCWLPGKYLSPYFLKEPFAVLLYKLQGKL